MKWLGGTLLAAALGFVAYVLLGMHGQTEEEVARRQDNNNLRNIVGLVVVMKKLPLKDGEFDPYAFFRSGEVRGEDLRVFHSAWLKTGPTEEEVESGDYTNFPWERYRGDGNLEGPPFPLLWEKKPDDDEKFLVGLSDGTAAYWDHATLEAALTRAR